MAYYLTKDELYHSSIQSQKYGVPEQKKFPLFDLDHVKSAIKFFNYVDSKYEDQLAKAILRRAKEYGLDLSEMSIGDNNRFKKYLPNDELKHHGILGQKWGIRRFQNADGTYTEEGKKRRLNDYRTKNDRSALIDIYNNVNPQRRAKAEKAALNQAKYEHNSYNKMKQIVGRINKSLGRKYDDDEDTLPNDWKEYATDKELGSYYRLLLKIDKEKRIVDFETNQMAAEFINQYSSIDYKKKPGYTGLLNKLAKDLSWESTVNGSTKYGKKTMETANSSIDKNKSNIAKEVSKGMISDIKRWAKEGDKKSQTLLKNNKLQEEFEKKVNNNINNRDKDSVFVYSDGTLDFTLDGFDEYQESQPLRVEYNPKTKKVNFDYL